MLTFCSSSEYPSLTNFYQRVNFLLPRNLRFQGGHRCFSIEGRRQLEIKVNMTELSKEPNQIHH